MKGRSAIAAWRPDPKRNPQANFRLFCFPYAGGNVNIFRPWSDHLPANLEVCPIQLPGRGIRLRELPFTRLLSLVREVAQDLHPYLQEPFAVFGHSLGALIAFEFARFVRKEHGIEPGHLFVSGYRAPQIRETERFRYDLPESELLEELRSLSGTPTEVLDHPDLMQLVIPILRADLEMIRTYVYSPEVPLSCPITAFGGLRDEKVTAKHLKAWSTQTTARFSLRMLPGEHFFIYTSQEELLQLLSSELARTCATPQMD